MEEANAEFSLYASMVHFPSFPASSTLLSFFTDVFDCLSLPYVHFLLYVHSLL
jgi:hypothetical protein